MGTQIPESLLQLKKQQHRYFGGEIDTRKAKSFKCKFLNISYIKNALYFSEMSKT